MSEHQTSAIDDKKSRTCSVDDTISIAVDLVATIQMRLRFSPWWRWTIIATRRRVVRRRLLLRICDHLDAIIRFLRETEHWEVPERDKILAHKRVFERLDRLRTSAFDVKKERSPQGSEEPDFSGVETLPSTALYDLKSRLKTDALQVAHETRQDHYVRNCLIHERQILRMRETGCDKLEASQDDSIWPSEELSTGWDLFLPREDLDRLIEVYRPDDAQGEAHTHDGTRLASAGMRAEALAALLMVYSSREEQNRYIKARERLRAVYIALVPVITLPILYYLMHGALFDSGLWHIGRIPCHLWSWITGAVSDISPSEVACRQAQLPFEPSEAAKGLDPTVAHLSVLSGAFGAVLGMAFRVRGVTRISEMRETKYLTIAQVMVGATTALVFVLVLRSGWVSLAFLEDAWSLDSEVTPTRAFYVEVLLIGFFVGLVEGLFLQLLGRVETMIGDPIHQQANSKRAS